MSGDLVIVVGLNALFFAIIIWVLHRSFQRERTFTDYAVGGRAFGPWYIAMSYVNSWFPGTMYISFLGLGVASGSVGLYVLSYSLPGVMAMYFMATRAWNWGQAFNLRTQPDMMRLRYNSSAVQVSASLIGVISLVPWVALSMQALGVLFSYMTLNQLSTTGALLVGVAVIVVRQYWTVRMGMRGLVITDLVQGIVAYLVCSVMIVAMFFIYFNDFDSLRGLAPQMWDLPGDGGVYGDWYFSAITLTGVIGSLCWPTSYQRIYTASSVRAVKLGTLLSMPIIGLFASLLLLLSFAMASSPELASSPQTAWFDAAIDAGGPWLLGLACVIVFAASMGWIDGCIQVTGTQLANDIVGTVKKLPDRSLTRLAKGSMVGVILLGAAIAYFAYDEPKLVNLAIISYQGVVQLAVPMFLGLFWRRGTREAALASMSVGFVVAVGLTYFYPDHIPWLGGLTAGVLALVLNLVTYLVITALRPQDAAERQRVDELFEAGRWSLRVTPGVSEEMQHVPGDGLDRAEEQPA